MSPPAKKTAKTPRPSRIRLLLVDDHAIVRQGIKSCLQNEGGFLFAGEAGNGKQALVKARTAKPDVVLMDINMPLMDGLEATAALKVMLPKVKVLILTLYESKEFILRAVQSGASGYLLKNCSPHELAQAIRAVHGGEEFFTPNVSRLLVHEYVLIARQSSGRSNALSARETEVLGHIARGKSNKDMAMALKVGVRTVETYRNRLMRKLQIYSVAELTQYALSHGIVST